MRHIEKDFVSREVFDYQAELRAAQMDEQSLRDPAIHPDSDGPAIYDMVRSMPTFCNGLKSQLVKDQGNICCYCGARLVWSSHPIREQYVVEHVFPKSRCRQKAGEYSNLLLSCHVQDDENCPELWHCDRSKRERILHHTPLDEDCSDFYIYDEFGKVSGRDEEAESDITEVLNLNAKLLKDRRQAAIDGEFYDENGNIFSDEELRDRLDTIMLPDERGWYSEFCFAIVGAIKHFLEY